MHPLRVVYRKYIKKHYGLPTGAGSDSQAEEAVYRIRRTGLSFEKYVDVSCRLLDDWATNNGWPFPYWNAVISNSTVERILDLMQLTDDIHSGDDSELQLELMYANRYIYWYLNGGDKPRRIGNYVTERLKIQASELICAQYGVECISSNYNDIAIAISNRGDYE